MYDVDYYPTQVTHDGQVVYPQQDGNFYMIFMYNSYMSNYFWCIVPLADYEDIIGCKTYADYVDGVGDVPMNKSSMTNISATPSDVTGQRRLFLRLDVGGVMAIESPQEQYHQQNRILELNNGNAQEGIWKLN